MQHSNFFLYSTFWGELVDDNEGTKVYGFENTSYNHSLKGQDQIIIPKIGGCFIVVQRGSIEIEFGNNKILLNKNTWLTTANGSNFTILENSIVAIFQRIGYKGMESIGLIESEGRLNYIDGCKDTILFQPIKLGLPCLNALFMPNGVHQTMHTHPSTRAGIIMEGSASCESPIKTYPLTSGLIFYLPKGGLHKFRTDFTGGQLKLCAYHPDSDVGPTDDDHAMLNRTIIDGLSAKNINEIKTK